MINPDDKEMESRFKDKVTQAIEDYNKIMTEAGELPNPLIGKALNHYRRYGYQLEKAERKTVHTPGQLMEALEEGWRFDPWLNSRGGPTIIGDQPYKGEHPALSAVDPREPSIYWVLVKGSPEQIATLEPFVELPEDEEEEPEPGQAEPYGLRTDYIPYDSEGKPSREPDPGYVVMHKDHVYAKGTVYTLRPGQPSVWAMSRDLAQLSGRLGVDEAHDVLQRILKG